MKPNSKSLRRMILGLTGYAVGLVTMNLLSREAWSHKYWLVLLPVVPLLYTASVIVGVVAELDEMWRRILCEAMAFSAVATGFTCFSYLFMRDMGAPEFRAEWAFYMMWLYYGIGAMISSRRYQ